MKTFVSLPSWYDNACCGLVSDIMVVACDVVHHTFSILIGCVTLKLMQTAMSRTMEVATMAKTGTTRTRNHHHLEAADHNFQL